jgi:hypothetical protein
METSKTDAKTERRHQRAQRFLKDALARASAGFGNLRDSFMTDGCRRCI